jgi:hypothetical protein
MMNHFRNLNEMRAMSLAAAKGEPFVPFEPGDIMVWSFEQIQRLPRVKQTPEGWTWAGLRTVRESQVKSGEFALSVVSS